MNSLLTGIWVLLVIVLPGEILAADRFVGSRVCSECHQDEYVNWLESGHHLQLRDAETAQKSNLPLPEGYFWSDISYVVGGVNKKACYLDQEGYVITMNKNGSPGKTLYNLYDNTWSDYFPGEKKPFDCAFCHTTGYQSEGNQKGLPGIVGTWNEDGIGCEACHGPGSEHASRPVRSMHFGELGADVCEQCHQRGGIGKEPLSITGLLRHHEQIDELKKGAHKGLSCLNCHNPHKKAAMAKKNCTICHSKIYYNFKYSKHARSKVDCIECHMAPVPKSAISRTSYIGHMRTHLFKIVTDPRADLFETVEEKGRKSEFLKGFLTVEYVCLPCHDDRNKHWAAKHAADFHRKK